MKMGLRQPYSTFPAPGKHLVGPAWLFASVFGQFVAWGVCWGALGGTGFGALLGLGIGSIFGLPTGAVYGFVLGVAAGLFLGIGDGIIIGLVSIVRFRPPENHANYERTVRTIAMAITFPAGWLAFGWILFPYIIEAVPGDPVQGLAKMFFRFFLAVPALIAAFAAWWTALKVAEWYECQFAEAESGSPRTGG